MSFVAFIKSFQAGDDVAAGDFARDARNDHELPDAETWRELELYLSKRGVTDRAIAAGKRVWLAYETRGEKVVAGEAPELFHVARARQARALVAKLNSLLSIAGAGMTCL